MRKLIVTEYTYNWVHCTAGMVLTEKDNNFELLRLFSDQYRSIFWCRNLCYPAIFEQRRYDLHNLGTSVGIKRAGSLNYDEATLDSNITSMITKLKVFSMFNMIEEVYIPNNLLLINIFKDLSDSKIFIYGDCDSEEIKRVVLEKEVYEKKIWLRKLMVGIHKKEELDIYKPIERFYKV